MHQRNVTFEIIGRESYACVNPIGRDRQTYVYKRFYLIWCRHLGAFQKQRRTRIRHLDVDIVCLALDC